MDVIGKDANLGVENLRGSGMIAGEASLAYEKTVTISMVSTFLVSSFVSFLCECAHAGVEARDQHQASSSIYRAFHLTLEGAKSR